MESIRNYVQHPLDRNSYTNVKLGVQTPPIAEQEQSKADSGTTEVEMKQQVEFLLGIDHAVLNSCPACDQSLHNIHSTLSYAVNPTFLN